MRFQLTKLHNPANIKKRTHLPATFLPTALFPTTTLPAAQFSRSRLNAMSRSDCTIFPIIIIPFSTVLYSPPSVGNISEDFMLKNVANI